MEAATDTYAPFVSETQLDELRDYFEDFGAWDEDEIASWTHTELNALFLQLVAGDIREAMPELLDDYPAYLAEAERGSISGRIYKCDIPDHEPLWTT